VCPVRLPWSRVAVQNAGLSLSTGCPAGVAVVSPLAMCLGERFEDVQPVRRFHFEKGLRSFAGWWWFATTGRHVG
jgi:hypothetical protein